MTLALVVAAAVGVYYAWGEIKRRRRRRIHVRRIASDAKKRHAAGLERMGWV